MMKISIRYTPRQRNILLFSLFILLGGIILALGWVNHRDFERSVIKAELRELLIIAKSVSQDIESGVIAINQEPRYIDKLIQHINDEEEFATFVMNDKHVILADPVKRRVGKNILEVGKEELNAQEYSRLNAFVDSMDSNSSGKAILVFPAKGNEAGKEMKLFAFARLGGYSVVVTESLSALTGPIYRNLRDISVLVGLFLLLFLTSGYILYLIQKKRIQMETASCALEIINRQLHCEIDDYKRIEKSLNKH
ncbi:MAG: hypothetical protein V1869_06205 [Candidatus Omnitrophota bacterium]